MINHEAIEIKTIEHFDDLVHPHAVPCTVISPYSETNENERVSERIKNRLVLDLTHQIHDGIWKITKKLTTYSNTNVSVSRVWTISCSVTMFECFNSFSSDASRIAVNGAPSSSCSLISLSATTWFVKLYGVYVDSIHRYEHEHGIKWMTKRRRRKKHKMYISIRECRIGYRTPRLQDVSNIFQFVIIMRKENGKKLKT